MKLSDVINLEITGIQINSMNQMEQMISILDNNNIRHRFDKESYKVYDNATCIIFKRSGTVYNAKIISLLEALIFEYTLTPFYVLTNTAPELLTMISKENSFINDIEKSLKNGQSILSYINRMNFNEG